MLISLLLASLAFPKPASAALLEIIHTNDLHSHFEHSVDPTEGSYAALKAQIDRLKSEAQAQGIETLVLDAGDFSEGTEFFLAEHGEDSYRMMDALGYDAVALGNHDYLMGQDELDRLLGKVAPNYKLLCANFDKYDDLPNLKR